MNKNRDVAVQAWQRVLPQRTHGKPFNPGFPARTLRWLVLCCVLLAGNSALAFLPPIITIQPLDRTVTEGGSTTFLVVVTSVTALSYQWYFQDDAIPGANDNTYTRTNVQPVDAGGYHVAVQNAVGTVNSRTAILTVISVNDPPVGANKAVTTAEDTTYTFATADFGFTDPNDSPSNTFLAVRISSLPAVGTLSKNGLAVTNGQSVSVTDINSGLLRFAPTTNASGAGYASFTFRVQDNGGTANGGVDLDPTARTLTVNVTAVNDVPLASAQNVATAEDTPAAITLIGSDVETGLLTFSIMSGPTNGVVSGLNATNGTLIYTPHRDFNGGDNFTFRVNDGVTDSSPATVSFTLTAVNDAPVADNQSVSTFAGMAKLITLVGTDVDSTALTFSIVDGPANGALSGLHVTNGTVTYTPSNNFSGADSFTFRLSDGSSNSAAAVVSITVDAVADIATTVSGPGSVLATSNFSYTITVTNLGFSAANGVIVSNTLPGSVVFVGASASGVNNGGVVTWPALDNLASGAATSLVVTVTAPASGMLTNKVASTAVTYDPDSSNNDGAAVASKVVTQVYFTPTLALQRLENGAVQLALTTPSNVTCSIQFSTNLVNWVSWVTTNSPSSQFNFIDEAAVAHPVRFYRVELFP